jgi:hypothetical protein
MARSSFYKVGEEVVRLFRERLLRRGHGRGGRDAAARVRFIFAVCRSSSFKTLVSF